MSRTRLHFAFLNIGHFLDHLFLLVFATAAALALSREWNMSYAELIPYSVPGFVAFAVFSIPAGWLADRWSRQGMMAVFFIGIGTAACATAIASSPLEIGVGLFFVGLFAAIYHPVGLALVVQGRRRTGIPLAINGVWGNLGVASAALITGYLIDNAGWREAFVLPGILSILIGLAYAWMFGRQAQQAAGAGQGAGPSKPDYHFEKQTIIRIFAIILISTAIGGLIFQSTTFALPKVLDERLGGLAISATLVGWFTFLVFSVAAIAQLVVGYFIDRHSVRYVFMVVAFVQFAFFALMPGLSDWLALIVATMFMLAVFGQIPINDVLIGRVARSEWRSRAYAIRYIVSFSVFAVAIPFIAWVHGLWGFDRLFVILAGAAGLIFLSVLLLPALRPAVVPAE